MRPALVGSIRVKICGLSTPEDVEAAVEAGADWLGFVFVPASPRAVPPTRAAMLAAGVGTRAGRVGLFVEPTDSVVAAVLEAVPLDVLQVYAAPERAAELRRRFGVPVWLATGVSGHADLPGTAPGVDALLLDAKPPPANAARGLRGGNAEAFDWTLTQGWAAPAPWLLAGGLSPENVAHAVSVSGAASVDVSSGVERSRGVKDPGLIRAFVKAARSVGPADTQL